MKKELKNYNLANLLELSPVWILIVLTPIFLITLFIFRFSSYIQFRVLIIAALVYLGVTIWHHKKDKTLTLEMAIEYVLIALLSIIILQGLLL